MLKSPSKKSAARSTEKDIQATAKTVKKRDHKKQSLILLSFTIFLEIPSWIALPSVGLTTIFTMASLHRMKGWFLELATDS